VNLAPYTRIVARLFPRAQLDAVERLAGGVSADVYRLDLRLQGGQSTSLVLRVHGRTQTGHSAQIEFQLMDALHRLEMPVPEPLLFDVSGSVLADPFVIMTFVQGDSALPDGQWQRYLDAMAEMLARIHTLPVHGLPPLPARDDPLYEVLDYLPEGPAWDALRAHLSSMTATPYPGSPTLLHGDFWPENLLWRDGAIVAVLDWEDAALGDPMSDLAVARLELRYRFGTAGMQHITDAYARHHEVDRERLALWQIYAAAAAQRFMGGWGLPPPLETHMRKHAVESIREAAAALFGQTPA
jgi:aminoglycoside phosphotransferase (APT) family kinase protein